MYIMFEVKCNLAKIHTFWQYLFTIFCVLHMSGLKACTSTLMYSEYRSERRLFLCSHLVQSFSILNNLVSVHKCAYWIEWKICQHHKLMQFVISKSTTSFASMLGNCWLLNACWFRHMDNGTERDKLKRKILF